MIFKELVTVDKFKEIMQLQKDYYDFQNKIDDIVYKYQKKLDLDYINIASYTMSSKTFEYLVKIMLPKKEDSETIFWWMYDLDFGNKFNSGSYKINDKNVKLYTVENLYNLLIGEPEYE